MMKWPLDFFSRKEFVYEKLRPADSEAIATLHTQGFHRPWNDGEFRSFLNQPNVFGFIARPVGKSKKPAGFVLVRFAAGEAEILTIAVDKSQRRYGVGTSLVETVLRSLHQLRAQCLFLEVDEQNNAAVNLYKRLGFKLVARRPAYYDTPDGKSTALVMRLDLT
ncbi:MAG: ribosomal protein S18-alanine N-acetyltransferase [Rhizobiaceae bacterium]